MSKLINFFSIAFSITTCLLISACSRDVKDDITYPSYYIKYEFEHRLIAPGAGAGSIYTIDVSCTIPNGITELKSIVPTYSVTYGPFSSPQKISVTLSRGLDRYYHKCRILLSHSNGPFAVKAESEGVTSVSLDYNVTPNDLK